MHIYNCVFLRICFKVVNIRWEEAAKTARDLAIYLSYSDTWMYVKVINCSFLYKPLFYTVGKQGYNALKSTTTIIHENDLDQGMYLKSSISSTIKFIWHFYLPQRDYLMSFQSFQLSKQIQNPKYNCKYIPIKVLNREELFLQLAINIYKWHIKEKYCLHALPTPYQKK